MDDEPQPDLSVQATPLQRAKDVLLRALDSLERAEADLGGAPVERVHLVVIYEVGAVDPEDGAWHSIGGWACTPGAKWEHAALLRRAADAEDPGATAIDDEPDSE